MTEQARGAVPVTGDAATEIGRVLAEHQTILYGVDQRARCSCGWIGGTGSWEPSLHRRDALLPVVEAECRRRAAERAASPVRAAAAVLSDAELNDALGLWYAARRADAIEGR